ADLLLQYGIAHDAEHPRLLVGAAGCGGSGAHDLLDQRQRNRPIAEMPHRPALLHQLPELFCAPEHFPDRSFLELERNMWRYALHDRILLSLDFRTFVAEWCLKIESGSRYWPRVRERTRNG